MGLIHNIRKTSGQENEELGAMCILTDGLRRFQFDSLENKVRIIAQDTDDARSEWKDAKLTSSFKRKLAYGLHESNYVLECELPDLLDLGEREID